jgi:hypothetical protein
MTARFYLSPKNLPELSEIPQALRYGIWSIAAQRAHRHWQVWGSYIVLMAGLCLLPRWDVHLGRLVFNAAFAIYLCIGVIACQVVKINFARRYIK